MKIQVSHSVCANLTTGIDRPHQYTHSIKKLANYILCKGVKLNDVIFHIVHLLLRLNSCNSITTQGQNLKFCTVVDSGGKMCNVILKSLLTLYFQFHIEK